MSIEIINNTICLTRQGETVKICACGHNCIRFQSSPNCKITDSDRTLMPQNAEARAYIDGANRRAVLETGDMRADIYESGFTIFYFKGREILKEKCELTFSCGIRNYRNIAGDLWKARVTFEAKPDEHFYGLGHGTEDCFDMKGCAIDLRHLNSKCTIPFVYSSLGYGFLWNVPSTGVCELAKNHTRWTSDCTKQVDYVVIGGNPREVCESLANLTGHAPMMPDWAMGFWQSRLRYETQEQVIAVAEKYKSLGIPLSVLVIDYFHWTEQGDWKFDPRYWPDPKGMCEKLHDMGVRAMVSVWPTVNEKSENYYEMLNKNMLIRTVSGSNRVFEFYGSQAEIDTTNPQTREFVWNKLKTNYLDNGIDCFWLDEAEPEVHPEHFDNLIFAAGRGDEVALLYPYYHSKTVYDGMKAEGKEDIITLARCAYLGSQKFGTLVWSGDIQSTFESLSAQIKSGLNMAMCGIVWWTTDVGGFYGGDPKTEYFRELVIRWFQYGVFCPVLRIHGNRNKAERTSGIPEPSGADNELWSFGNEAFEILRGLVLLRERLKLYIKKHMRLAFEKGTPIMRPMFFDFPEDESCYGLGDQYMFGDDILFAPITVEHQTRRTVYLPAGKWIRTSDRAVFEGGATVECHAEINDFIAFVRDGAEVIGAFSVDGLLT